jgi:RNA polymerase sigma factor (sigma-70 family)
MSIVPICHSNGVACFACAQAGCMECQEALLRANEGLVHYIVQRQEIGGVEYQDLVQAGRIALWQSILHFDPGRGNPFVSYAWPAIRHQVWRCLADAEQSREYVEIEEGLDLPGQAEAAWQEEQVQQLLREELECLPERLRRVICLVYGLEEQEAHSLAEIGREWGVSRERIRQLRNEALVLLRLPALSQPVRFLCEQDSRAAYHRALALNRAWQRSQRRRS